MGVELHVALDIGSAKHRVAIGLGGCREPLEEFDMAHTPAGLSHFFKRVRHHEEVIGPACVYLKWSATCKINSQALEKIAGILQIARKAMERCTSQSPMMTRNHMGSSATIN